MADPVVATQTPSAARKYGYGQLSADNRAIADNVAALMLTLKRIDGLPVAQRKSAIDKLNAGDWQGLFGEVWGGLKSGIGWVSGGVTTGANAAQSYASQNGVPGVATLGAIERLTGGATTIPGIVLGMPSALLDDARRYFSKETVGIEGKFWGTTAVTESAAREFGAAYASALQVRQEERGTVGAKGFFGSQWASYWSAGAAYLTQYITYYANHWFGDKTATWRSFENLVHESQRSGDMPFVAESLLAAGTIAGIRVTPAQVQTLTQGGTGTLRDGSDVVIPPGTDYDANKKDLKPKPKEPTEGEKLGQHLRDMFADPVAMTGVLGGGAATVYTEHRFAPLRHSWNGAVATGRGTLRAISNAGQGFWSGFAEGVGKWLPSSETLRNQVTANGAHVNAAGERAAEVARQSGLTGGDAAKLVEAERIAAAKELKPRSMLSQAGDPLRPLGDATRAMAHRIERSAVETSEGIGRVASAMQFDIPRSKAEQDAARMQRTLDELVVANKAAAEAAARAAGSAPAAAAENVASGARVAEDVASKSKWFTASQALGKLGGRLIPGVGIGFVA